MGNLKQSTEMRLQYHDLYNTNKANEIMKANSTTPIPANNDARKEGHSANLSQQMSRTVGDHYGLKSASHV